MSIEGKIAAISYWQNRAYVHPLTCGVKSSHANLIGQASGADVILLCPTCGYEQKWIPEMVYDLYAGRERYEEAMKNHPFFGKEAK